MSPRSARAPCAAFRPAFRLSRTLPLAAARRRAAPEREERDDDREEREPVEAEAGGRAERVERDAREDRADDAREVELDRVQRDGVREVLLVDERRDEGLVGRASEGLREAHDEGRATRIIQTSTRFVKTRPARRNADESWTTCESRRIRRRSIRSARTPPKSEKTRNGASWRTARPGEVRRLSGDRQDEPALRDRLHPRPDARRERARPQQAEVPVRERLENASQPLTHDGGA